MVLLLLAPPQFCNQVSEAVSVAYSAFNSVETTEKKKKKKKKKKCVRYQT
jgi:hypothetical protein